MRSLRGLAIALAIVASMGGSLFAADTGTVSGLVFDQGGQPLAGATVKITGERLPAGRTAQTDSNGAYNFQALLPGQYTVEVAPTSGGASAKRAVIVEVDKDTQVDLALGMALTEDVQVSAAAPTVDLKNTEVNFNYSAETIEALPLARTYAGLFQLIPGVAENDSFAPAAGGSRQDNTYLIDGVNITNPGFGYLSTEVNEFDIVEFNVKRAGISAEFGRSSGFVANAVTRSGTNRLAGGLRVEVIPSAWIAAANQIVSNPTDRYVTSGAVGGPILMNRIFFYASGQVRRETTGDRRNNFGELPDRKVSTEELFGKITATPSNAHFFNGAYRHRPSETRYGNIGINDSPALGTHSQGTNRVANGSWNWFPDSRTAVEVKYLRLDQPDETVAVTDLGFLPTFDINNLAAMGNFFDPKLNARVGGASQRFSSQSYDRTEVKGSVSRFLDFAKAQHQIKVGFGWEDTTENLTRLSNGWGTLSLVQNNTQIQSRYYPVQPSQLSKSRTYTIFVQDDITITQRLVVNAGLLLTRDEFAQQLDTKNTFLKFGFGDEIQPRIGVNYNLRKGAGDKIYGSFGNYINLEQKSSSRSLAPKNLFLNEALFDATTGRLISDTVLSNSTNKVIDPNVKPPYFNEFVLGYATPLMNHWSVDVFFMFRDGGNFIEDTVHVLPASTFIYENLPAAERRYRALTFELNRQLANKWSLNLSYALSKFYGNADLDGTGSNGIANDGSQYNTSSFLQDGPGIFVEDTFRWGPLNQDRPHVFKALGTYQPLERVTLGGSLRVQSGTPYAAMGQDWYGGYRRFLEPSGSRRNDTWTNVDLLAAYRLPLTNRVNLTFEGRLLNVFDAQTALFRDTRQYLDGRIRLFTSSPPAGCFSCYTDLMVQGTTQPNPLFGQPTDYADPRRLLLTARLAF
jgi:hypothetical protein